MYSLLKNLMQRCISWQKLDLTMIIWATDSNKLNVRVGLLFVHIQKSQWSFGVTVKNQVKLTLILYLFIFRDVAHFGLQRLAHPPQRDPVKCAGILVAGANLAGTFHNSFPGGILQKISQIFKWVTTLNRK